MATKRVGAQKFLEDLAGCPLTLGRLLESIRLGEGLTQVAFAGQLGISRQNLCDIEKDRASVSPACAARRAKTLGHSEHQMVALVFQRVVDAAGLRLQVTVGARPSKGPRKPRAA